MINCNGIVVPEIPDENEFLDRCKMFERNEKRDLYYKVAIGNVSGKLDDPEIMANRVGLLLLNWNWHYYRYGNKDGRLNLNELKAYISKNCDTINKFRDRDISELTEQDDKTIELLFADFTKATMRVSSKTEKKIDSKVSAAKALHVLAPTFFPLWDRTIAHNYAKCSGLKYKSKCEEYIHFCKQIKCIYEHVRNYEGLKCDEILSSKNLIKLIDEYNYSKYSPK